jgi:hemin uptake protein HemP
MMPLDKKEEAASVRADKASRAKRVKSETLMGDRKELVIEHAGREYVLRITQNGKLILTA